MVMQEFADYIATYFSHYIRKKKKPLRAFFCGAGGIRTREGFYTLPL
jgi:hypothetical protein